MLLSTRQKDILVGLLLGSGSIVKKGGSFQFSIEKLYRFKEFFSNLLLEFKDLEYYDIKLNFLVKIHMNNTKSVIFSFSHNVILTELYELFYDKNGIKRIIYSLYSHINLISLSFWYMDKGILNSSNNNLYFNTLSYSFFEILILKSILQLRFCYFCTIHRDGIRYKLYFCSKSRTEFLLKVRKHLYSCADYKCKEFSLLVDYYLLTEVYLFQCRRAELEKWKKKIAKREKKNKKVYEQLLERSRKLNKLL